MRDHKPYILWELQATLSSHGLAVDHQGKVVKQTLSVGHGGQTFTVCGDLGLCRVPDTGGKEVVAEVVNEEARI